MQNEINLHLYCGNLYKLLIGKLGEAIPTKIIIIQIHLMSNNHMDIRSVNFNIIFGTSISCSYISGVVACMNVSHLN